MKGNIISIEEPLSVSIEILDELAGPDASPVDYYESSSKQFMVKNAAGRWLPYDVSGYSRILRSRGLRSKLGEGETLTETDMAILDVQNNRDIVHCGPLCGRMAGLIEENGIRALVTEDMRLLELKEGDWPVLEAFLRGLFQSGEKPAVAEAQLHTFLGWMKSSVGALRDGREQQQQALALCGPANCGKSLLQHLITDMLGGRSAKADRYFTGRTSFNADLFMAEHLILEDNHVSTRISDRQQLGARLKEHCVGVTTASLHAKGRNAVNLRPWWRVTITLNDDPEAMTILPPLDDHLADKLILLRASQFDFPMPVSSTAEKIVFRRTMLEEIPHFLDWLLSRYSVPTAYSDPRRYNVQTFHHPVLKEALEALSPESDLLDFIDLVFGPQFEQGGVVELRASEIEGRLRAYDPRRAEKILSFRNACGTFLGRLAKKRPERVVSRRTELERLWRMMPPTDPTESANSVSGRQGDEEITPEADLPGFDS